MNFTATEAKNRLGQVLEEARTRPVFIEKAGRPHSVVIGIDQYEALLLASQRGAGSGADAGKRFYAQYKDWVDEQNRLVDKFGIFGEEFRPW